MKTQATDTPLMQQRTVYDDAGHTVMQAVLADAGSASNYVVDPNTDMVTEYAYDDATGTYPGMLVGTKIYYAYDSTSGTSQTAVTSYDYDLLGRRYKTTDPDGNETILSYDEAGRVWRRQQKDYHPLIGGTDLVLTTDYEYDCSGWLIRQTAKPNTDPNYSGDWQVSEYRNALSYRVEEEKPNGIITSHTFNTFGQKVKTVADDDYSGHTGLKQTTEWGFDRPGRQVSIAGYTGVGTGGTKQTTTYTYDKLGNVTLITYPDAKTIEYMYNDHGKVKKRTDQRGWVTDYKYDKLRNLTQKEVTVDSITTQETFTYDGLGRMVTADKTIDPNDVSLIEYAYNDIGKITDFDQTLFGGTERQIDYAYDQYGFLESMTYPDGSTVIDRTNDWRGRIATLSRGEDELAAYDYIGSRVAKRSYDVPNVAVDFDYDNLGRVTDVDYGASIVRFGYAYEADENNIDTKTFHHRTGTPANDYDYDDLDRLTDVEYLGNQSDVENFVMDAVGNRTGNQTLREDETVNFTVDSSTNRYTSIGGIDVSHDDAGNMNEHTRNATKYHYDYDYENRVVLIKKETAPDTWAPVAEHAYDALGRRIRVIDSVASTTTLYYYNPEWQCLAEYNGAGALQRYFVYGNYIDEPLVMHRQSDGEDYYYGQDHLYSTVVLLDDSGNVVERYEYDSYGTTHIMDASYNPRSVSSYGNPFTFTGRRLDILDGGDLLRMHYRHRDYDMYAGRFMQHDKLGVLPNDNFATNPFVPIEQYSGALSLYEAELSNPLSYGDPYGLLWLVMRQGSARATATVLFGTDTVSRLAGKIKLDASEFRKWMQLTSEKIKTVDGKKTLAELEQDDRICPMEKVTVPNTYAIIKGDVGNWARLGPLADLYITTWIATVTTAFERRGYQVLLYDEPSSNDVVDAITEDWWGIGLFGHGSEGYLVLQSAWGGWVTTDVLGSDSVASARILNGTATMFKLGGTIGFMCHADEGGWKDITAGKTYLAHGLLSAASGPRGVGWWGSWESLVRDMTGELPREEE